MSASNGNRPWLGRIDYGARHGWRPWLWFNRIWAGAAKQGSLAPPLSPDFAAMPDRTGHDERSRRERIAAGLSAVSQKWMSMCLPAFLLGPGIRQRACLRAVQGQACRPGGWQRRCRLRRPNLARSLEETASKLPARQDCLPCSSLLPRVGRIASKLLRSARFLAARRLTAPCILQKSPCFSEIAGRDFVANCILSQAVRSLPGNM